MWGHGEDGIHMPRGEAGGAGPAHPGSQPPSPRVWGHKCLLCEPCRLRDAVCSCQLLRGTFLCHGQDHGHTEVFCTWPRRDSDSGRKPQLAPQSSASPVHGAHSQDYKRLPETDPCLPAAGGTDTAFEFYSSCM